MEIKGKVHCFFEQSGTFKNEFIKLGIPAEDYDIQNNFGQTDHVADLFQAIEDAYDGKPSLFDSIKSGEDGDLILAFFPCIYFCGVSQMHMSWGERNYKKLSFREANDLILERVENRAKFLTLIIKLFELARERNIRLIVENPWSMQAYLKTGFVMPPTLIDNNRMLRGDYFIKPTAYWFVNCKPTNGQTEQLDKKKMKVWNMRPGNERGVCSEDRSLISPDYARNFICYFVIGKDQKGSQLSLF